MILRNLREGKGLFQEYAKVQDTLIRCCFFHVIGILEEEKQFVVKFNASYLYSELF